MSFKRTKVVMLPTNKKALNLSPIVMFNNKLFSCYSPNYSYDGAVFQNLYFLSDDEIKEGDYVIEDIGGTVYGPIDKESIVDNPKKIIATTDKLEIPYQFDKWSIIPQPSDGFIQKFVDSYNDGNPITEVDVEYNHLLTTFGIDEESLRINPKDNTITIKKVKDTWNREEVVDLFNKMYATDIVDANVKKVDFDKWIEENL